MDEAAGPEVQHSAGICRFIYYERLLADTFGASGLLTLRNLKGSSGVVAALLGPLGDTDRGDDGLDLSAMNADMVVAVNAESFDVQQTVERMADRASGLAVFARLN